MLIEILAALVLGIVAGTATGLSPGIHINLIASILLASIAYLPPTPPIALAVFIVAMSITHTFLDFIPSIFLGAPEEDTFLSILPGHELLQEGKGFKACILTLYGSLLALPIILIFTPIFILFLPFIYSSIKFLLPFILIFLSLYLCLRENNISLSLIIFVLSGFLGLASFNLPIKEPLLPLLTGLFGISSIFLSIKNKQKIKEQTIETLKEIPLPKKELKKSLLAAVISAPLCSFLPGIGSGHAATIGSEIIPQNRSGFLLLTGSINTIIMALSFVTIYAIGRARSGTAATIKDILATITLNHIVIIILSIVASGIISFFIGIKIAKLFALSLNKINYKNLSITVIILLLIINIIFSSWLGILVLITSTFLGIFCILSDSKRINLMGSLIIPAILYYLIN